MKQNNIFSLLGLAAKSRNLLSGEFQTEGAIKERKAKLVIVALDASGNTTKKFENSCSFYKVPFVRYGTKAELGHFIGKEARATVVVTDEGFAKAIIGKLEELQINTEVVSK